MENKEWNAGRRGLEKTKYHRGLRGLRFENETSGQLREQRELRDRENKECNAGRKGLEKTKYYRGLRGLRFEN